LAVQPYDDDDDDDEFNSVLNTNVNLVAVNINLINNLAFQYRLGLEVNAGKIINDMKPKSATKS
jgi:hypothetical protein